METIITISFASVLLLSFIAEIKKDERLFHFRDFVLILLSVGFFLKPDSNSNTLLYLVTITFLTLNFGLSFFSKVNGLLKHFLPLVMLPIFVFVDQPLVYGEYSVSFGTFNSLLFIALGYFVPQMINLKYRAVSQLFVVDRNDVLLAIGPVILGVMLFAATFFHSTAGLFLVTIGLWAGVLLHHGQGKNLALFSLGILLVHPFISLGNIDTVDITLGKTIEGLLFGAFSVLFVIKLSTGSSKQVLSSLISVVLVMLLFTLVLILGTQKADLGGVDAYIAGIYGMSLMFLATSETEWKSTVFVSVILSGLIVVPLTIDPSSEISRTLTNQDSKSVGVTPAEIDPFNQKGLDLGAVTGEYTVDDKNVDFTFELGPKGGRTKGKFKSLKGEINILDPLENSKFDIQLNVSDLTTMNKFRDESLFGEEYFNVTKFPEMSFKSQKLISKNDSYELIGEFVMMGVKKPQTVTIKLISDKDEVSAGPVLIGKGSIDRTLFGMKPDPKEGNIVDFQFEIKLLKVS